jgi:hypothetical protein
VRPEAQVGGPPAVEERERPLVAQQLEQHRDEAVLPAVRGRGRDAPTPSVNV